ncbi:MarR family transcriptional regulator [Methylopila jiangsuensis]|uniref:MarR family transcriptional regulator n=1 Tax=Methylopila jiangsuensis TaxID=586230 RepID=A0A9W6JHA9_9HYPH|nr:MarR family transcriptional regulator [Methylopila jiangsuensis]MDR6284986.1 DNA-binding MarR family transcriptional regulator [Methylopila jiangsuensis]GLK77626.1 MarR family transcriptional regulator [Methylopila jiangsuensis]
MTTHTPEGEAVTDLILAIFLAYGRIMKSGDALLDDLGITGARWQILGAIKNSPKTVAQIARRYELSRQGVLWNVQGLVKDGLVEFVANPDHKRAKLLVFTDLGRKTHDEIEMRQRVWSNALGRSLGLQDVEAATRCVQSLGELMKGSETEDADLASSDIS